LQNVRMVLIDTEAAELAHELQQHKNNI